METMIIGVAGPSAGGKTSVTHLVEQGVGQKDVQIINYDDYYKDQSHLTYDERTKTNYDHPNAFDTELLIEHLNKLRNGEAIDKPIYDFKEHNRKKETERVEPKPVIILEGLFALLDEEIRDLMATKIFVYEDSDICFIRRLKRDIEERGRSMESVIDQYMTTVKPMQEEFIDPTKKFADIIILRGKKNEVAIQMMIENIQQFLVANNIK